MTTSNAPVRVDQQSRHPDRTAPDLRPDTSGENAAGHLLVDTAVLAVPGAEWASITRPSAHGWTTTHGSHDLAWTFDQAQYDTGEGPCLLTASGAAPDAYSVDVAHDLRWPTFGRRVGRAGVGSVLSFGLTTAHLTLGSLNLYGSTTHAFTSTAEQLGRLFAAQGALMLGAARHVADLRTALESRDVIGQAKGILMAQEMITPEQAFRRLVGASQSSNCKLRDIAEHVRTTGELPRQ